jgi:hypothetical protein
MIVIPSRAKLARPYLKNKTVMVVTPVVPATREMEIRESGPKPR